MQDKRMRVNIDNVQETISRRRASDEEYTIRKKSQITPHAVSYKYDNSFSQMPSNISQIKKISDLQPISVKAKVLQKGDCEDVNVRGKTLTEIDFDIANEIKLSNLLYGKTKSYH